MRYAAVAVPLMLLWASSAHAQTVDSLLEEAVTYNDEAFELFKSASELMGTTYAVQACRDADAAVQAGIRARNLLIRARRLSYDTSQRRQLSGAIYDASQSLNGYKTLYNAHCGNTPYEMTPLIPPSG